jgi:hypothetical protein
MVCRHASDMQDLKVAGGGGGPGRWPHHPADRVKLCVALTFVVCLKTESYLDTSFGIIMQAGGRLRGDTGHENRPKTRHTSLALYVLIRGIALLIRCGNKSDAPPLLRR